MIKDVSNEHFFEELYLEYEQKIYFLAYSIINNEQQAEDITQDVFEQLFEQLSTLKTYDSLTRKKYILRISKNRAIDYYRKNKVELNYKENLFSKNEEPVNNVEIYFDSLISEEQFNRVTANLKDSYLDVFMYRIYYGLSGKETAELMNIRVDTVKKQLERAKKKVKEILEGELKDG